jgi:histidinol-phosphate/aromatic aminotransferase/cobyric acid decarboxylase-like protein/GNAT superfamily N-acetyltransferase
MESTPALDFRSASDDDREWIYRMRHDVYARELGQHQPNGAEMITDDLDSGNVYIVAASGDERIGFVSVTPPWLGRYSFEKYVSRSEHPLLNVDGLFEIRVLTVDPRWRGSQVAPLLMYAALRWVASRGGRQVVAMGRSEILPMYLAGGLQPLDLRITSGAVTFEFLHGDVQQLTRKALTEHDSTLRRLEPDLRWELDVAYRPGPDGCEHGGASFDAIGRDFATLGRRHDVVAADVLDAWFPPAPGVIDALTADPGWNARTSPPAAAEGLVAQIAETRGLDAASVVVGAGSSDLIFTAFRGWLTTRSRVLMVDPTYGEYAHVLERVVGCRVDRLEVRRENGWRIDPVELGAALRQGYDLVVLVNPNNPTGRHLPVGDLREALAQAPRSTRVWVDEAYVDYAGPGQSLERDAASSVNIVVCKSLSKMYALSGLRAAYVVAGADTAAQLRRWTPPWAVSLPAQIAAVRALQDPTYYTARWAETRTLRADLARGLASVDGMIQVEETVANFVLVTLPTHGPTAPQVVRACRSDDVFLRDLSPLSPAFEGRTIRIAVKDADANARVVRVFQKVYRHLHTQSRVGIRTGG